MWLFFGLPIAVLFIITAIHASYSLDKLKSNWNEYRCHPMYIPFAGVIRPDVSTSENFYHCIGLMGNEVFKPILDVLNSQFSIIHSTLAELTSPLAMFRKLFERIRKFMLSFTSTTFSKITTSTSTFTYYLIKIRDLMKRFAAEGYIAAFLANAGIDFVMSFVMLCMSIIKTFVYAMLLISFILAMFQPELLAFFIFIASMIGASGF
jgi:hypothetical protein